jgi:hypothetical protein
MVGLFFLIIFAVFVYAIVFAIREYRRTHRRKV